MLSLSASVGTSSSRSAQALLQGAFGRREIAVPEVEAVASDVIPEPYHGLLVHEADMTSTLSRYHGDQLVLSVLHREETETVLEREVLLCRSTDRRPVEYGVIRIALDAFGLAARDAILEGRVPLGQILDSFEVTYQSRPSAYLRVANSSFLTEQLNDGGGSVRYGRVNTLSQISGVVLAEVVEILPVEPFASR